MAGDWLKVETATPDKPEIFEIASSMGIDPDAAFGKCFRVWSWFDQHTEDGHAPVTVRALLDRLTGVPGFCEAMENVGWLPVVGENGSSQFAISNFDRHIGQTAKNRALANRRKAASRSKQEASHNPVTNESQKSHDENVTEIETREEKRRYREDIEKKTEEKRGPISESYDIPSPSDNSAAVQSPKVESTPPEDRAALPPVSEKYSFDLIKQIASGTDIPENVAEAFYQKYSAIGWVDDSGNAIVSPGAKLAAFWRVWKEREAQSGSKSNGKREAWHVEKDIERVKAQIKAIQKNPLNRNKGKGHTETKDQHRERLEGKWLKFIRPLRDEFRETLSDDWKKFTAAYEEEMQAARDGAAKLNIDLPIETQDDDLQLMKLAEMFPKDVPTFERWAKEFEEDPWIDPDALTFEAMAEVADCRETERSLEAEKARLVNAEAEPLRTEDYE